LLDLTFAQVGVLADHKDSWPDSILMNEFIYGRFDERRETPKTFDSRLPWLLRQPEFRAQPYMQLAKVLDDYGKNDDAVKVLIEMNKLERQQAAKARLWPLSWFLLMWSWLLDMVVGYGYKPMRAFGWGVLIVVAGWRLFRRGYRRELVVPADKDVYEGLNNTGELPVYYQRFNSFVYSLETFLLLWICIRANTGVRVTNQFQATGFSHKLCCGIYVSRSLPAGYCLPCL
jgi:hypothetical protein